MRNDARPIGEASPASPVGGDSAPGSHPAGDDRGSVTHDRQSHIVHPEEEERRSEDTNEPVNPVLPSNDATVNTRI